MKRASSTVSLLARELGLEGAMKLHSLRAGWEGKIGGPVSLHTCPVSLKGGLLMVNADSPGWLQQLNFSKDDVLRRLEGYGVRDIRFRLGRVERITLPRRAGLPAAEPSEDDERFIEEITAAVLDPELARRVEDAVRRWASRRATEPSGRFGDQGT